MNLENARKNLVSDNPESVIAGLKILAETGKLTDLQPIMALVNHPNQRVKKAAADATASLIRENLITHFHELGAPMREKLGTLMQSMDPAIIDGISEDLYCDEEPRRLRAVQVLGLLRKIRGSAKFLQSLCRTVMSRSGQLRSIFLAR